MIDMYGFSKIWSAQNAINVKYISAVVKQRLQDEFIQIWYNIYKSSRGHIYKILKKNFSYELPQKLRKVKNIKPPFLVRDGRMVHLG